MSIMFRRTPAKARKSPGQAESAMRSVAATRTAPPPPDISIPRKALFSANFKSCRPRLNNDVFIGNTVTGLGRRSEEHTSELQSLMRISYAVFCLKKKNLYFNHLFIILSLFTVFILHVFNLLYSF